MKPLALALAAVLGMLSPFTASAQDKREQGSYAEMRAYLGELFEQKKYAEAAAMLERVLDRFPDNVRANTYNLAAVRVRLDQPDTAIDALQDGLRRGAFYSRWDFDGEVMAPLKQHPRFPAFFQANLDRIAEADKKAVVKLKVATPPGYDPVRRYPLFMALHGGGENIAVFKPNWVSPRLQAEFIIAWIQSSQVADMTGFHWQDEARTQRDLQAAYSEVVARYAVDPDRVIVGGFSSGGFASLVTAFHQTLPARGFVALCPPVPETITDADISAAVRRGLRGSLLTTDLNPRVQAQRGLAERWKKLELDGEFTVTPNVGHWYPKDFGQQLDRAIDRILAPLPPRAPSWSRMASGTTNNLTGLWGTSPSDIFAAGPKGTILHFDGRAWSPIQTGTTEPLGAIYGFSGNDVFVVGGGGTILRYTSTPAGSSTQPGPSKEREAVEQTIHGNICWALTKDRALAERTMAHDADLFIFNPDSKATIGWNELVKNFAFWMDPRFKAVACDIRDLRVTFSRSGDVAWWSAILDDLAEWDGRPTGWKDTRWTGVLEKRDGAWVIVQMHFSFAADKVKAEGLAGAKK